MCDSPNNWEDEFISDLGNIFMHLTSSRSVYEHEPMPKPKLGPNCIKIVNRLRKGINIFEKMMECFENCVVETVNLQAHFKVLSEFQLAISFSPKVYTASTFKILLYDVAVSLNWLAITSLMAEVCLHGNSCCITIRCII